MQRIFCLIFKVQTEQQKSQQRCHCRSLFCKIVHLDGLLLRQRSYSWYRRCYIKAFRFRRQSALYKETEETPGEGNTVAYIDARLSRTLGTNTSDNIATDATTRDVTICHELSSIGVIVTQRDDAVFQMP